MNKLIYIILGIFLITGSIDFQVLTTDINTNDPIEAATVLITNTTLETVGNEISDINGFTQFTFDRTETYNVTVTKIGYELYTSENLAATTNGFQELLIRPFSQDGIIRLRVGDMTFTNHEYCLYFRSNDRLYECYQLNDTAKIHNNVNYTMRIKYNKLDAVSSPTAIINTNTFYIDPIIASGLIIGLTVMVYAFFKRIKK